MTDTTIGKLRGRSVIDSRGTDIGAVGDVTIDPDRWSVTGLVVDVRKEVADDLKLDRHAFGSARIDLGPERIQAIGETVLLNVSTDDIAMLLRQAGSASR